MAKCRSSTVQSAKLMTSRQGSRPSHGIPTPDKAVRFTLGLRICSAAGCPWLGSCVRQGCAVHGAARTKRREPSRRRYRDVANNMKAPVSSSLGLHNRDSACHATTSRQDWMVSAIFFACCGDVAGSLPIRDRSHSLSVCILQGGLVEVI